MASPAFPLTLPERRPAQLRRAVATALGSGGGALAGALSRVLRVARIAPDLPVHAPDWIVVPGFRLRHAEVGRHFARRLDRALALWRRYPHAGLAISGRAGDELGPSEALAGLERLIDLGLPSSTRVLLEPSAGNSLENLLALRRLLPESPGRVVIVSNRYHLARLGYVARGLGLDWELLGAEPRWRWTLGRGWSVLREAGALLAIAGRDGARFDTKELLP